jgi:plasmid replication initiation protein
MQQLPLPGELVKKSNAIARARWQPESIWETRIVALVASKVRTDDEDFFTYRIPVRELTGGSSENLTGFQYQEIKKSILHIAKAIILIPGKNPQNFMSYHIFSACGYEDGYLIARFDPDLKPHFLNLASTYFTAYNLFEYLKLPSVYSQRIFEFLKSWENASETSISVAELHELLNSPESFRKDFREFRRWVLDKAHKDITKKTTLLYEWEALKKGRSYVSVKFVFGKKQFELQKEKTKALEAKNSKARNKAFIAAVNCASGKQGICAEQDNKRSVCKLCIAGDLCGEQRRIASGQLKFPAPLPC